MKSENNEFTLWVVICAIIGLFIWQMPNIERLLYGRPKKDKTETIEKVETNKEEQQEVINNGRVTCGMTGENNETIEYQISYNNSKANKVTMITTEIYDEKNEEYKNKIEVCNNISSKYANQKGFSANCTNKDTIFETKYVFDLKEFKEFIVDNGDNTTDTVSIDIDYNEKIEDVMEKYQQKGATCK